MEYLFVLLIGVILTIVGLWLSYKPVKEGMANTDQVMLGGLGPGGDVYIATTGLTGTPNWTNVSGKLTQVSGSLGQMVGVSNNTVYYGTQYSVPESPYTWVPVPGSMIQVDFDYPMVVGINTSGKIQYIDDISIDDITISTKKRTDAFTSTAIFTNITSTQNFKWVSIRTGRAYAIGTDNLIYYTSDLRKGTWRNVSGSLAGKTFVQVSYDGNDVVVLDNANKIYYANSRLETEPNWKQLTASVKQITLKDNMLFCIGTDNRVYFSPSQTPDAAWVPLTSSTTFSYLTCFYPRNANMVKQRPSVMTPCKSGYNLFGGECLNVCPTGFRENGAVCSGIPVARATRATTFIPPTTYTCPIDYDINVTSVARCVSIIDKKTVSGAEPLKELYLVRGSFTQNQAAVKCLSYGGQIASLAQMNEAVNAGAGWCEWGWYGYARDSNNGTIGFPVQPETTCTISGGQRQQGNRGHMRYEYARDQYDYNEGLFAVNCYGVKPPKAQFSDVAPFNTANQWNQAPQCPFAFNVTLAATCKTSCPTGTSVTETSCIFPVIEKETSPRNNTNYTCPAGFDPPAIVTCSGNNCGTVQICTQSCPAGYTRNGISCTPPPNVAKAPLDQSDFIPAVRNWGGLQCQSRSHRNLIGNRCYVGVGGCPIGAVDIGNNMCRYNIPPNRGTINAIYTSPCPTGFVELNGQCYENCPTGSNDIGNNSCQRPNIVRTTSAPTANVSTLTLCGSTEDLIGTQCATKCSPELVSSDTTCAAQPTKRTGYKAIYNCNSNETMLNGVCTTKCPEGSYADGQLCVPGEEIIPIPSSITCISSPFKDKKKWLCDTPEAAAALLKNPSKTTSYVDPNDQVCVADDPSTNMYYCESGADAKENTGFIGKIRTDYRATCDNVKKNYMDLSNNITSLLLIQSGMTTGKDQLAAAKTSLDGIFTKLNCANPSSAQVTAICNQIRAGSIAIGTDSTDIGSVLTTITKPIQDAMTSRDSLLASITNFQCSL